MKRLALFVILLALPYAAVAQNLTPVVTVNGEAITAYELDQRIKFLKLVRQQGNLNQIARDQLIEDRLKLAAARRSGIQVTPEGLDQGVADFAARANLQPDEFLKVTRAQGIDDLTVRNFVESGITWRELIRERFANRAQISEDEIDRSLAQTGSSGGLRVLLNEIILPARPNQPGEKAKSQRQAQRLTGITSIGAFQAEARKLSVSQSRARSGKLEWLNLNELPAPIRPVLLGLRPGQVTDPIELPNAILLFQMRKLEEVAAAAPEIAAIDYAALYLPGGRSDKTLQQAERIKDSVDTCDDLYGVAKSWPREQLERGSKAPAQIPRDVAIELAKLDPGEVSTTLTRANGDTLVFLMLCNRSNSFSAELDRGAVRNQLRSSRLAGFADGYLAQLRADAVIINQ